MKPIAIAEGMRAEEALEKELRLRTALLDNIPGCIALILKKGTREIVAANRAGLEIGAVPGQTCFKTCGMRDDNCPFCLAPKLWATGQVQQIEVEYRGTWYEGIWAPLSEDLYVHYIFDITERKQTEDKLRHVARLYALLSQINQAIVRTREQDELFRTICQVAIKFGQFRMAWVGLTDEADDRVKPVTHAGQEDGYLDQILITTGDMPTGDGPTGSAFREGEIMTSYDIATEPRMLPWRDEALKRGYRSSAAVPFRRNGKPVGTLNLYATESGFFTADERKLLQEIGKDISFALDAMASETERKKAEEALRESEERFKLSMEATSDGLWDWNVKTDEAYFSPGYYRMLGYEVGAFPAEGNAWKDLIHPDDREHALRANFDCIEGRRELFEVECRMKARNGEWRWILSRGKCIARDEQGRALRLVGTHVDVTERKRAEEALRESEAKYYNLFEETACGFALYQIVRDDDGKPVDYITLEVNREFERLLNVKKENVIGKRAYETTPNLDKEWLNIFSQVAFSGQPYRYEQYAANVDKWFEGSAFSSRPGFFAATFVDITERKRAEEALRASLAGKEVLLKEVHHRVKNNLTAIIGLLELQRGTVTDPATVAQFHELEGRIRSMALVHETLYHSESLVSVNLQTYLETLIAQLGAWLAPLGHVRFSVAAAGVKMGLDTAIPCGLILSELITNAFKYAFPGDKPRPGEKTCEITVSAEWDSGAGDEGVYTLTVADNGVGLPADLDWATTKTLGLRLVRMLGQYQLKGRIELDRASGTSFRLVFASRQSEKG